jgi:large exoprotein involved in heme utilization and adhesion
VDQFNASTGGQLRTTAFNSGQAGNIFVTAANQLNLSNPETGLFANTAAGSTGNGGNIFVNAGTVFIRQDAGLAVGSLGTGQGGSIQLTANQVTLSDRGFLTAETASAQGGNINLDIRDILLLRRNSLISATAGTAQGGGDGGNITIKALFIVGVLGENSDIRANAFTGNGGKVNITAQGIFGLKFQSKLTPFSDITASSQFGTSGTVTLNLPNIDPNRGLVALPLNLVDPSSQISQGCSAIAPARQKSRFVALGRGGLPISPEQSFEGSQVLVDLVEQGGGVRSDGVRSAEFGSAESGSPSSSTPPPLHPSTPPPLIEAQGWAIAPNGIVSLIAQTPTGVPHSDWQPAIQCPGNAP